MIYLPSKALGSSRLSPEDLKADKTAARPFEDCGLGEKALYLSAFGLSRVRYIPLEGLERVFKRLAVSKGFFEEGKIYGTISYLVLRFEGREKQIRFSHEEELDALLAAIRTETSVPVGKP